MIQFLLKNIQENLKSEYKEYQSIIEEVSIPQLYVDNNNQIVYDKNSTTKINLQYHGTPITTLTPLHI
jgi:hypothetical protein